MERVSENYESLSAESKARYAMKVTKNGLRIDPYAIPSHQWLREPDVIPAVKWSDMFTYLVCTPSPYTQEELKVFMFFFSTYNLYSIGFKYAGMERSFAFQKQCDFGLQKSNLTVL